MCVQSFHMVTIDVPAGVGALPVNTQIPPYFALTPALPPVHTCWEWEGAVRRIGWEQQR